MNLSQMTLKALKRKPKKLLTIKTYTMTLIERIEYCKQMAKEMKEITPDVSSVTFRIDNVSIGDMQALSGHYNTPLEKGMTNRLMIHLLDYCNYSVFLYSVECEINTTIEYKEKGVAA